MFDVDLLSHSAILHGLDRDEIASLSVLASERHFHARDTVLTLGQPASELLVVASGGVELTLPLLVLGERKDVGFVTVGPGDALAWSAIVPPNRLTMGARATEDTELLAFDRQTLLDLCEAKPEIGRILMGNLAGVIATRLLQAQALWAREVQRGVHEAYGNGDVTN